MERINNRNRLLAIRTISDILAGSWIFYIHFNIFHIWYNAVRKLNKMVFLVEIMNKTVSTRTQLHGLLYILRKEEDVLFWISICLITLRFIISLFGKFKTILSMIDNILFGKFIIAGFSLIFPIPIQIDVNNQDQMNGLINRLKFETFTNQKNEDKNINQECVICCDQFKMNDNVFTCIQCKKCYHNKCFTEWIRINPSCPNCRKNPLLF